MITELKSVHDIWKRMPTERHARLFLENAIWGDDRFCPHCGSLSSRPLRSASVRPGLYQCAERDCRSQFTVTTKTPLHATKLDLRIWIAAMFLVLTSSKGISSVVMSRLLGVNQKTAWKLGHAIRELMDDRHGVAGRLSGVVEVDEAFIGGKPKFRHGVKNKRGRGTGKPIALVAAARNGQARAVLIPNAQGHDEAHHERLDRPKFSADHRQKLKLPKDRSVVREPLHRATQQARVCQPEDRRAYQHR